MSRHQNPRFIRLMFFAALLSVAYLGSLTSPMVRAAADSPGPTPAGVYGALAKYKQLQLSPSGNKILLLQAYGETYHLAVLDLVAKQNKLVLASDPERFLFQSCAWANEERILCAIDTYQRRGNLLTEETRLLTVNADGSDYKQIKPPTKWGGAPLRQDRLLHVLPDDPKHILMEMDIDAPYEYGVYRVNVYSGRFKRLIGARSGIYNWWADGKGVVRAGTGLRSGKAYGIYRSDAKGKFSEINLRAQQRGQIRWIDPNASSAGQPSGGIQTGTRCMKQLWIILHPTRAPGR